MGFGGRKGKPAVQGLGHCSQVDLVLSKVDKDILATASTLVWGDFSKDRHSEQIWQIL